MVYDCDISWSYSLAFCGAVLCALFSLTIVSLRLRLRFARLILLRVGLAACICLFLLQCVACDCGLSW